MKRQANFEVLRVVAMAMIVALHFLQRGGILVPLYEEINIVNATGWLIKSFCIVAANSYVLIAGYFLVGTEWKCKKLLMLLSQILFYSLLVPVVCMVFGIGNVRGWSIYEWITAVLPLQMDHYWFATAYVLLFVLSPVLAAGIRQLSKKQLELVIGILLVYFCVFKSLSPILLATDRYGYDYPWFICLFLIAAYIRLYGGKEGGLQIGKLRLFTTLKESVLCYILSAVAIFAVSVVLGLITARIGKFDYYMNMVFSYNHILTLLASVAVFYAFMHWEPKESKAVHYVSKIAPYTFGVYLIHENAAIRDLWTGWFLVEKVKDSLLFVPYMVLVIICLFAVCMAIDYIRACIFKKIFK